MTLGTVDEVAEIWECVKDQRDRSQMHGETCRFELPPGWTFLGAGRSRSVYLSPSGVAYKVCHFYGKNDNSSNDIEHENFATIESSGRLPEKWKVPRSHLHYFRDRIRDYNGKKEDANVCIMACEYIPGSHWADDTSTEMYRVFASLGLWDTYTGNVIQSETGINYIIDAAEGSLATKWKQQLEDNEES